MAVPTTLNDPANPKPGMIGSAGGRNPVTRPLRLVGANDSVVPGECVEILGGDTCAKVDGGNALADGNNAGIVVRDDSARGTSPATAFTYKENDVVVVLIAGRVALTANAAVAANGMLSVDADDGTSFDDDPAGAGNAQLGTSRWVDAVAAAGVGWVDYDSGGVSVNAA